MNVRRNTDATTTAIQPCAPTASCVDGATPESPLVHNDDKWVSIVLVEADTARRSGRWLHGINYLNLAVDLYLFFAITEITYQPQKPPRAFEMGMGLWFMFDFMPMALVFAGAHRLKHLKGLVWVWIGVGCMLFLAIQRLMLSWMLAGWAVSLPQTIPPPMMVLAVGLAAALINAAMGYTVLRLLVKAGFRKAFR